MRFAFPRLRFASAFALSILACTPGSIETGGSVAPGSSTATPSVHVGVVRHGPTMALPRAAHAASALDDGRVLITGGFGPGDGSYSETAELFDPASDTVSATASMATRRCCHTSTTLRDGRILIAGGFDGGYLDQAEIFDPATGAFSPAGRLNQPRMDHAAVLLPDGRVLLVGGVGTGWTFLATAEIFDPASGTFTPTGSMASPRESLTATLLRDGRVLVTGGHRGRHSDIVIYDSAEIYDVEDGTFSATGAMLLPRHKHDAVLMADGKVLISGGSDETDDLNAYRSTEIFDPRSGEFSMGPEMPSVRYKHTGTSLLLKTGGILLAGGARQAALVDPRATTITSVPGAMGTAPLSRLFATATLLADGRALIAGGYGIGQEVTSQTWIYVP